MAARCQVKLSQLQPWALGLISVQPFLTWALGSSHLCHMLRHRNSPSARLCSQSFLLPLYLCSVIPLGLDVLSKFTIWESHILS